MKLLGRPVNSFTTFYNGWSDKLFNNVQVAEAFDPATNLHPEALRTFQCIWDTGATNSVITQNVVSQCLLRPTGMVDVSTPKGSYRTETFLVNILLPNHVGFSSVRVSKGELTGGYDVLIGMDIIGKGDFAVTNKDGKTAFSFRIPSLECIDFVKSTQAQTSAGSSKIGRNAPCPCGSGKKYKRCCGKQA